MIPATVSGTAALGCIVTNFSEPRDVSIGTTPCGTDIMPVTTIAAGLELTSVKKAVSTDMSANTPIYINGMTEADYLDIKYWM